MTRKLSEDEKESLRLARAFEPMLRSEGWQLYAKILEAHKDRHMQGILSPTTSTESIYAGEREKGTVVGISLALNLPKTVIGEAEAIRKKSGEDTDE